MTSDQFALADRDLPYGLLQKPSDAFTEAKGVKNSFATMRISPFILESRFQMLPHKRE